MYGREVITHLKIKIDVKAQKVGGGESALDNI